MITRYRAIYFAVVVAAIVGVGFGSAASKAGRATVSFELADLQAIADQASGEASAPPLHEKGNLSEAGAVELTSTFEWKAAVAASRNEPTVVFKHSTQCEISAGAYRRVRAWMEEQGENAPKVFLVKVIEERPVSQRIEQDTGVKHESPQVIVLDEGKPVFHTSHEAVTADALDKALADTRDDATAS